MLRVYTAAAGAGVTESGDRTGKALCLESNQAYLPQLIRSLWLRSYSRTTFTLVRATATRLFSFQVPFLPRPDSLPSSPFQFRRTTTLTPTPPGITRLFT